MAQRVRLRRRSREVAYGTCVVDWVVGGDLLVLGDLTHAGDQASADEVAQILDVGDAVGVWAVRGNHDAELTTLPWSDRRHKGRIEAASRPGDGSVNLLVTHYPALSLEEETTRAGLRYAGDSPQALAKGAELAALPTPTLVLAGHLHVRASATRGSVLQLSFSSLIEPPHEVALVELSRVGDEASVVVRHVQVGECAEIGVLPVLSPASERWVFGGAKWREV